MLLKMIPNEREERMKQALKQLQQHSKSKERVIKKPNQLYTEYLYLRDL